MLARTSVRVECITCSPLAESTPPTSAVLEYYLMKVMYIKLQVKMERGNKREVGIFLALLCLMGRGSEPTGAPVGALKIKAPAPNVRQPLPPPTSTLVSPAGPSS
jgi:hypothetical protein